jgi:serine/threonine protein kinase
MAEQSFARFKIVDEIGIGGMSLVYQAYDPTADRSVAIKILPPEYIHDLGLRANFEQEARLISGLEHESIVPVLEYGAFEGQPYLVMPFMPKGSLAERLVQGPLSPQDTARILERLADALDYTHRQGVVHRDLKPSNVLFDEGGEAFLADFGIALQNRENWSGMGVVRGSPEYLSPEQALRNESIDGRSDVYSLGVIVYEMLCGVKPFRGDAPMVVVLKQIHDEPPLLRSIDADIPAALEQVVLRAMAKDAGDRYQSAGDFSSAFQQAIENPSTSAASQDLGLPEVPEDNFELVGQAVQPQFLPAVEPAPSRDSEDPAGEVEPEQAFLPGWRWSYILALGIVLWAGALFGVASAAVVHRAQASVPSNLQVVIDKDGVSVTNISQAPVDISGLSFRRLSESGDVVARFQASQWERLPDPGKGVLQAGACYQLLEPDSGSLAFATGTPQPRPSECQELVGWLSVEKPDWVFWSPQGGMTTFQVVQDGKIVKTCPVQERQCEFYLSPP